MFRSAVNMRRAVILLSAAVVIAAVMVACTARQGGEKAKAEIKESTKAQTKFFDETDESEIIVTNVPSHSAANGKKEGSTAQSGSADNDIAFEKSSTAAATTSTTLANGTESGTDATTESATDSDGFINKWY